MTSIYRIALRLLPAELHRKHGAAMEALYARELENARKRGRLHEAAASATGIWDVIQRSTYELVRRKDFQMGDSYMPVPTTRELLRRHAISFGIAFIGLTVVLMFTFASRQLASLNARGASAGTIIQSTLLALPFIAAMTIPMAVFISVLHEFTRLGANGALAAARHARDGVRRLVIPVVAAATGVTVLAFIVTAEIVPRTNARLANVLAGAATAPGDRSMTIGALREAASNISKNTESDARSRTASYEVEIQKKLALPTACLVLALAGMALAFRIPRGGLILVFGGSLVFFGVYYGLIMTGEVLAGRLVVSPFVGMWGANAFVLVVAMLVALLKRGTGASGGTETMAMHS